MAIKYNSAYTLYDQLIHILLMTDTHTHTHTHTHITIHRLLMLVDTNRYFLCAISTSVYIVSVTNIHLLLITSIVFYPFSMKVQP